MQSLISLYIDCSTTQIKVCSVCLIYSPRQRRLYRHRDAQKRERLSADSLPAMNAFDPSVNFLSACTRAGWHGPQREHRDGHAGEGDRCRAVQRAANVAAGRWLESSQGLRTGGSIISRPSIVSPQSNFKWDNIIAAPFIRNSTKNI